MWVSVCDWMEMVSEVETELYRYPLLKGKITPTSIIACSKMKLFIPALNILSP